MINKRNFFIVIIIGVIGYFSVNAYIGKGNDYFIKSLTSYEQRQTVKKYLFPYKMIEQLEKELYSLDPLNKQLEIKKNNDDISILKDTYVGRNYKLKRYQLSNGFNHKINHKTLTGSGYIDFHKENLIVLSPLGILGYVKNLEKDNIQQIKNNIDNFIGYKQFSKNHRLTLKDLFIDKDSIYISYTEEIEEDCWNTGIIYGDMNYEHIEFKSLFSADKCVHMINKADKVDRAFSGNQSGGRIVNYDENHILLSIGEFRERWLAQDIKSINGKVLKININTSDYEIISMGHRNPQGLYYDKENNYILETEHGPHGGDEINLIKVNKIDKNNPINFGWPIVSDGIHYCSVENYRGVEDCDLITKKYPLHKDHNKYGYEAPLHSFSPSIGISDITKIGNNSYVVAAMGKKVQGGKSLYFFDINKEGKLTNLEQVEIYERVRDIKFYNNNLYLFLGDSASIGVLSIN